MVCEEVATQVSPLTTPTDESSAQTDPLPVHETSSASPFPPQPLTLHIEPHTSARVEERLIPNLSRSDVTQHSIEAVDFDLGLWSDRDHMSGEGSHMTREGSHMTGEGGHRMGADMEQVRKRHDDLADQFAQLEMRCVCVCVCE